MTDGLFESTSDERVRAVVGSAGQLVDLTISAELLSAPARNVAQAVFDAVSEAQRVAAQRTEDAGAALEQRLADALAEVTVDADRRLAALATLVDDLSRRADLP